MDNLTHSFIGLAFAKAGLERLSPAATTVCVLAANSPDIDIVTLAGGRWVFLQQHRGLSHSLVGAFTLALALPLTFYAGDLLLAQIKKRSRKIKLPGLILASLVATATHPLMDWTNNYGVRPLLPWNPRWFYGDFVFIVDPVLWLLLGGAGFLLTAKTTRHVVIWALLGLVPSYLALAGPTDPELLPNVTVLRICWIAGLIALIYLYRGNFGGRAGTKVAIGALALATIYCAGLAGMHSVALKQARAQAMVVADKNGEKVVNLAAMPTVANPTAWVCLLETDRATYKFRWSVVRNSAVDEKLVRYEKPAGPLALAVAQAKLDDRSQVFLGFARFPVAQLAGVDCASQTLVQFADLRYTEPGRSRGSFSLEVPVECPALKSGN